MPKKALDTFLFFRLYFLQENKSKKKKKIKKDKEGMTAMGQLQDQGYLQNSL